MLLQLQGIIKNLQYFTLDCFLMLRLNTFMQAEAIEKNHYENFTKGLNSMLIYKITY